MHLFKRLGKIFKKDEIPDLSPKSRLLLDRLSYQDLKELSQSCESHDVDMLNLRNDLDALRCSLQNEETLKNYLMQCLVLKMNALKSGSENYDIQLNELALRFDRVKNLGQQDGKGPHVKLEVEQILLDEKFRHSKIVESVTRKFQHEIAKLEEDFRNEMTTYTKERDAKLEETLKSELLALEKSLTEYYEQKMEMFKQTLMNVISEKPIRANTLDLDVPAAIDVYVNHTDTVCPADPSIPLRKVFHESIIDEMDETKDMSISSGDSNDLYIESLVKSQMDQLVIATGLESEIDLLKRELDAKTQEVVLIELKYQEMIRELEDRISQLSVSKETDIKMLIQKRMDEEAVRRRLHNQLMEVKGNIRVFCRVRPPITGEADHDLLPMSLSDCEISIDGQKFLFNEVYGSDRNQTEVFKEMSQFVRSAVDGYKVCMFAYGQTGSGKTFTMTGTKRHQGMIYLSVNQIFSSIDKMKTHGWKFQVKLSLFELYNDVIQDLIEPDSDLKYEIKDKEFLTEITNMTVISVSSAEEMLKWLEIGNQNRTKAYTACNVRSSRSHSITNIEIIGKNSELNDFTHGVLNFVDLAGSERLKESNSTGKRLTETKYINKSLSSLGDVIHAISKKESFIPFRSSKLTWYLKNYLCKDSKCLMFANISPLAKSKSETMSTLRFATQVNSCELGTATKLKHFIE